MEVGVVEIRSFEPILNTGEVAVLLAAITLYGVLSMANFAILGFTAARRTTAAYQACGVLAAVNYIAGLVAIPLVGSFVGLPVVAEVTALMYLELSILALIVSRRRPPTCCEFDVIPRAKIV